MAKHRYLPIDILFIDFYACARLTESRAYTFVRGPLHRHDTSQSRWIPIKRCTIRRFVSLRLAILLEMRYSSIKALQRDLCHRQENRARLSRVCRVSFFLPRSSVPLLGCCIPSPHSFRIGQRTQASIILVQVRHSPVLLQWPSSMCYPIAGLWSARNFTYQSIQNFYVPEPTDFPTYTDSIRFTSANTKGDPSVTLISLHLSLSLSLSRFHRISSNCPIPNDVQLRCDVHRSCPTDC